MIVIKKEALNKVMMITAAIDDDDCRMILGMGARVLILMSAIMVIMNSHNP